MDCNVIPNLGCFGGRRQYSFNYTIYQGLTLADNYPYIDTNGECTYNKETDMVYSIDHYKVYENMINHDLQLLACNSVVAITMRINNCIK